MILILLFTITLASRKECKATSTGIPLSPSLARPETFGGGQSPCMKLDSRVFKEASPYDTKVLNIEHIVELQNSEMDECDKDIFGNVILADAKWNRAVGNLCWKYGSVEKQQVYGPIFQRAIDNVRACCIKESPNDVSLTVIAIVLIIATALFVSALFVSLSQADCLT